MRLATNFARLAQQIEKDLKAEVRLLEKSKLGGIRDGARGLRGDLRGQVSAAGLGPKLAKSWRDDVYPNRQSGNPAALIRSKAPAIMRAAAEGPTIRPTKGQFLAWPTELGKKMGFGRGRKMTARGRRMAKFADIEKAKKRFGALRVAQHPREPSWRYLIADNVIKSGGRVRKARQLKYRGSRRRFQKGATSVALFVLKPDSRWRQRINVDRAARVWAARTVNLIDRHMSRGGR